MHAMVWSHKIKYVKFHTRDDKVTQGKHNDVHKHLILKTIQNVQQVPKGNRVEISTEGKTTVP